jgi:hypothetical protein
VAARVTWTDWLISLHLLSAFALMAAMTVFWAVVLATRSAAADLPGTAATAITRPAAAIVGAGALGTLIFGIWLSIDIDGYELWDGWILAAIVLWAVGSWLGQRSGVAFIRLYGGGPDATGAWRQGASLLAGSTIAYLIILILMIFKPGA